MSKCSIDHDHPKNRNILLETHNIKYRYHNHKSSTLTSLGTYLPVFSAFLDSHRADSTSPNIDNEELEFSHSSNEVKDYFLPPVFTNHDEEEDDDDDNPYLDYDYDKETNYKDSPDVATVNTNAHTHESVDDKIPLHTAKDNLPIFLLEPENTYVVKNKPAILKCRAANALEVSDFMAYRLRTGGDLFTLLRLFFLR